MQQATGRRSSSAYLGGVEVQVIVLLVGRQVLVLVVGGGSHQHHPVAVVFTAGVKTHHHPVPLEDLQVERSGANVTVLGTEWKHPAIGRGAPSAGTARPSPAGGPSSLQKARIWSS